MPASVDGLDALHELEKAIGESAAAAMKEMAMVGQREAIRNAPRSPTTTQARNARKKSHGGAFRTSKGKTGAKAVSRKKPARAGAPGTPSASSKGAKDSSAGLVQRPSRRTTAREAPGGLERSIKSEFRRASNWEDSEVELFVQAGSEATKYARKIEEERFKTWRNRGVGTVRKGARAREFFVRRAAEALPVEKAVADAITAAVNGSQG